MKRLHWPQAASGRHQVTGDRFHHLVRVLRVAVGEPLEVFDGHGHAFSAQVVQVGEQALELELSAPRAAPSERAVWVVQAMPKADKLELVLQKATELGATGISLAWSERCVVKPSERLEAKTARWAKILEEAARQCGRADVPALRGPVPLAQAVPDGALGLVLDEEERALPLGAAVAGHEGPLALVVGPEGGLTREEVAQLTARGARAVTLGARVLRTETAALAALAVVRHLDGSLG
ncbi:MAG: 16S rRNA (uracil(1498)-N(3))-methyltransferase [Myxococcaceae bacterium]|nr:16S rRNA (uracil(1498)-N(3))-methyltransferase [Myxococcaceae bacterium]